MADTVDKDQVTVTLESLGVAEGTIVKIREQLGAETPEDLARLTEADLVGIGMKPLAARKLLEALKPEPAAVVASTAVETRGPSFDVLPSVPDEESFLQMLKVGGELKVGTTEVISAVRAGLATRLGLYELPSTLVKAMEDFAEKQDEPCSPKFYELQRLIAQRSYAEVLSAIGVSGQFVSETRKKNFLERVDGILWTSLMRFHEQLKGWQEGWAAGVSNPGVILAALAMGQSGSGMLPPGMMQPPATDSIRDASEDVIDQINKVFAGMGIPISRALAYDASQIRKVLEDSALPATVGAASKEQMLKTLRINVAAGDVRLERNLTRYVLSIMDFPKVTSGNEEYAYLGAMIMLGNQIPWDQLGSDHFVGRRPTGIGSDRGKL